MLDKDEFFKDANIHQNLRNQMRNYIWNIGFFVKYPKYYRKWKGLGLIIFLLKCLVETIIRRNNCIRNTKNDRRNKTNFYY